MPVNHKSKIMSLRTQQRQKVSLFARQKKWLLIYGFLFSVTGCSKAQISSDNAKSGLENKEVVITIDASGTYQKIDHFGASDAWSCQFVGNWPDAGRNAIADLLFSQDTTANGQPLGIGLSVWRFNIGAGSTLQGEGSQIRFK